MPIVEKICRITAAADLATHPAEAVCPIPADLISRLEALTGELGEVDLDAPIEGAVTL